MIMIASGMNFSLESENRVENVLGTTAVPFQFHSNLCGVMNHFYIIVHLCTLNYVGEILKV